MSIKLVKPAPLTTLPGPTNIQIDAALLCDLLHKLLFCRLHIEGASFGGCLQDPWQMWVGDHTGDLGQVQTSWGMPATVQC
eukprot:s1159_g4.t1